ncbi:hypothetical protein [Numidum massiliense]|uniref:hypothetical protein n=1 Tax=Numidum massiliense TaxID=1522315 RepID=UPI0006D54A30|nr:hypothetical protein [Numidum massiliense]
MESVKEREPDLIIKQGDTYEKMRGVMRNANKEAVDVTDCKIYLVMATSLDGEEGEVIAQGEGAVVDGPAGEVEYQFQNGDTRRPGTHITEFKAVFPDGRVLTQPVEDYNRVHIIPSIPFNLTDPEPEPPVENVWTKKGNPKDLTPLPVGWQHGVNCIVLEPGQYTLSFNAKSDSLAWMDVYIDDRTIFGHTLHLEEIYQQYNFAFEFSASQYERLSMCFYAKNDAEDIYVQDIMLVRTGDVDDPGGGEPEPEPVEPEYYKEETE